MTDLRATLQVVLDCVDYTVGNCSLTAMVGAALPPEVIVLARQALQDTAPPDALTQEGA